MGGVIVPCSHATAEGNIKLPVTGRLLKFGKTLPDFIQNVARIAWPGIGKNDGEFFATKTANMIGFAQALFEKHGEAANNTVANGVAVGVIHLLEVINIDHRKAQ